jgi:hypothetical protein
MNRHSVSKMRWPALALGFVLIGLGAAPPAIRPQRAEPEDLVRWEWYQRVNLPTAPGKLVDLAVPTAVFGRARSDLGDLRLVDGQGRPIPYALRIRRPVDEQRALSLRAFDRIKNPDHSLSLTLDLGDRPSEHNEIAVSLSGKGFGRPLRLEGSSDGKTWGNILDGVHVVNIEVAGRRVEQRQFSYPPSRLRYLRLLIRPDRILENDRPEIEAVQVFRSARAPGEDLTTATRLLPREPVRSHAAPASAWRIDLGEEKVPCAKLILQIGEEDFVRPYVVEALRPGEQPHIVASGVLRRELETLDRPVVIEFPSEVATRYLRLTIVDYRNPPLSLMGVEAVAPLRQVVFAPPSGARQVWLYVGNTRAQAPRYDFAASLPARLEPAPDRAELGPVEQNPDYRPEPKPWTERWPYLVDTVLAIASGVLLCILGLLANTAIRQHDGSRSTT